MSIEVFWDELKVLNIDKKDRYYISTVESENLLEAKKKGFPVFLLKQISTVSEELPSMVMNRLSAFDEDSNKINFKEVCTNENLNEKVCNYVNETHCKRPTDKISIQIDLN